MCAFLETAPSCFGPVCCSNGLVLPLRLLKNWTCTLNATAGCFVSRQLMSVFCCPSQRTSSSAALLSRCKSFRKVRSIIECLNNRTLEGSQATEMPIRVVLQPSASCGAAMQHQAAANCGQLTVGLFARAARAPVKRCGMRALSSGVSPFSRFFPLSQVLLEELTDACGGRQPFVAGTNPQKVTAERGKDRVTAGVVRRCPDNTAHGSSRCCGGSLRAALGTYRLLWLVLAPQRAKQRNIGFGNGWRIPRIVSCRKVVRLAG